MVYSPWVRIKQIVSLILLAYAGADLFVPRISGRDDVPPAVNSVASLDESDGPETPGSENPNFDDCFCCCSHIALPFFLRSEGIFATEQFSILKFSRLLDGVQIRPFNPARPHQV